MLTARVPGNVPRWLERQHALRGYRFVERPYHRFLSEFARANGVGYVDLAPAFQRWYRAHPTGHPEQLSWPINGSWRGPGHRLAAETLAGYLVESGRAR